MINETIKIWHENEYEPMPNGFEPIMDTYVLTDRNRDPNENPPTRPAVLVLPGGGYEVTSHREAEPIAMRFNGMGFNSFVLYYSCAPAVFPQSLKDVSRAICIIRDNAEKWHIDKDKIFVIGFSAGGHLAGSIGVLWDLPELMKIEGMEYGKNKPNAIILSYPVIIHGEHGHLDSFKHLLGDAYDEKADSLSLEKLVSDKTPPAFIWHTYEDGLVPVENSLEFGRALRAHNIPFEMHIYTKGGHGLSLANEEVCWPHECDPHAGSWIKLCEEWLKMLF